MLLAATALCEKNRRNGRGKWGVGASWRAGGLLNRRSSRGRAGSSAGQPRARGSVLQAQLLEGLGLEQVEPKLTQLLRGECLHALLDLRGQRAELRFQEQQRRLQSFGNADPIKACNHER